MDEKHKNNILKDICDGKYYNKFSIDEKINYNSEWKSIYDEALKGNIYAIIYVADAKINNLNNNLDREYLLLECTSLYESILHKFPDVAIRLCDIYSPYTRTNYDSVSNKISLLINKEKILGNNYYERIIKFHEYNKKETMYYLADYYKYKNNINKTINIYTEILDKELLDNIYKNINIAEYFIEKKVELEEKTKDKIISLLVRNFSTGIYSELDKTYISCSIAKIINELKYELKLDQLMETIDQIYKFNGLHPNIELLKKIKNFYEDNEIKKKNKIIDKIISDLKNKKENELETIMNKINNLNITSREIIPYYKNPSMENNNNIIECEKIYMKTNIDEKTYMNDIDYKNNNMEHANKKRKINKLLNNY